jgi:1-acyl-sn-glycerol-3-phosphate acyltransferase
MIRARKIPAFLTVFRGYNRFYLKRHFSKVMLLGEIEAPGLRTGVPLLVCLNHTSWWDLLVGMLLEEQMPARNSYTAMDERQLARYRFFSLLGVIGVDRTCLKGIKEFTRYCTELMGASRQNTALWLTVQGEMVSSRQRPIVFQPGAGWIAREIGTFDVITVAVEYAFWDDRLPVVGVSISAPRQYSTRDGFSRLEFTTELEKQLESQCNELVEKIEQRDASAFITILSGSQGVQPVYDAFRAAAAFVTRKPKSGAHSDVATPGWRKGKKG